MWIEATSREMTLGDSGKDYLLKGRYDLVIGGRLCLGLKGLGLSHLDFHILVEELD